MESIHSYQKKIGIELQNLSTITAREAELEAQFILQFVLKETSTQLIIGRNKKISENDVGLIESIVKQRLLGTPLAYLFKEWDFYGRTYYINQQTLIPRQDTELMIDILIQNNKEDSSLKILDLGTGSGVIGLTLAHHFFNAQITLSDISSEAIKVAKINGGNSGLKNIQFVESNWFEKIPPGKFDIIVSNPPYIPKNDKHLKHPELLEQPQIALMSELGGLQAITDIVQNAKQYLNKAGLLMIEHGFDQAPTVKNIFTANTFNNVRQYQDINSRIRITSGVKI